MTARKPQLLVVDDEAPIRKFLRISLTAADFAVLEAAGAAEALELVRAAAPDAVILDLGLPGVEGEELILAIRAVSSIPIIVLSVRASEQEKIAAFEAGASDYVTKPFALGELVARIRAVLRDRHPSPAAGPVYEVGDVRVDVARHLVLVAGAEVKLTPKEFALLAALIANSGRVVTHRQLLHELWGKSHERDTQYLRVYVGQLRHKLGDDPADPRYIANEPGVGYRFIDSA